MPLILATLGFTFLGEGLRDALDPKLQAGAVMSEAFSTWKTCPSALMPAGQIARAARGKL